MIDHLRLVEPGEVNVVNASSGQVVKMMRKKPLTNFLDIAALKREIGMISPSLLGQIKWGVTHPFYLDHFI